VITEELRTFCITLLENKAQHSFNFIVWLLKAIYRGAKFHFNRFVLPTAVMALTITEWLRDTPARYAPARVWVVAKCMSLYLCDRYSMYGKVLAFGRGRWLSPLGQVRVIWTILIIISLSIFCHRSERSPPNHRRLSSPIITWCAQHLILGSWLYEPKFSLVNRKLWLL
jgi:hypothetical protein